MSFVLFDTLVIVQYPPGKDDDTRQRSAMILLTGG